MMTGWLHLFDLMLVSVQYNNVQFVLFKIYLTWTDENLWFYLSQFLNLGSLGLSLGKFYVLVSSRQIILFTNIFSLTVKINWKKD